MSFLKERPGYDFKLRARELNARGFLEALGECPIVNEFPPHFKTGTLGFSQVVTLKDGRTVVIDQDEKTPPLGSRVIVYEYAKSFFRLDPQE